MFRKQLTEGPKGKPIHGKLQACTFSYFIYFWRVVLSRSVDFNSQWTLNSQNSPASITSVPEPGRKFLMEIVRPRAGKGASMTLLMSGWTKAGEMPRLFSTSSKIWMTKKEEIEGRRPSILLQEPTPFLSSCKLFIVVISLFDATQNNQALETHSYWWEGPLSHLDT